MISQTDLKQQLSLYQAEVWQDSIVRLEQEFAANPDDDSQYWKMGTVYLLNKSDEQAEQIWTARLPKNDVSLLAEKRNNLVNFLQNLALLFYRNNEFRKVIKLYSSIQILHPNCQNKDLKEALTISIKFLLKEISYWKKQQNYIAAEEIIEQIIKVSPDCQQAWYERSLLALEREDYIKANEFIVTCLRFNDTIGKYHLVCGLIFDYLGQIEVAIQAYQQALRFDSHLIDAYNHIGTLFQNQDNLTVAIAYYQKAISINPYDALAYLNLNYVYLQLGQFDDAIAILQTANQHNPNNPEVLSQLSATYEKANNKLKSLYYLGYAYYIQGKFSIASQIFEEYLRYDIEGKFDINICLADCHKKQKNLNNALSISKQALSQYPDHPQIYIYLIFLYQDRGETSNAIELAKIATEKFPQCPEFHYLSYAIFPIIYQSVQEIESYGEQYQKGLAATAEIVASKSFDESYRLIQYLNIFSLSYNQANNLAILKSQSHLIEKICQPIFSSLSHNPPSKQIEKRQKIRIGYISNRIHSLGHLFLGWLKYADRSQFEIFCYQAAGHNNSLQEEYARYSDHFSLLDGNPSNIARSLQSHQLDILVYLECGIDPFINQVASQRIVPIQCVTWGHPDTSGMRTIDYFLSNELMEAENADQYYSEKLIRLFNLGVVFSLLNPATLSSKSIPLVKEENTIFYLCSQSLPKYLPQYDYIFPAIAQKVNQAKFIFFNSDISENITILFQQRLKKAFDAINLDYENYCIFLTHLDKSSYLKLNELCDVFLDTIGYSGCFTTVDAIASNLPIVTMPGDLMKSRQSYGILKMIDVLDTVAHTEIEYVDIAIALGQDPLLRQDIKNKIANKKLTLFDDRHCIDSLEQFYRSVVNTYT